MKAPVPALLVRANTWDTISLTALCRAVLNEGIISINHTHAQQVFTTDRFAADLSDMTRADRKRCAFSEQTVRIE